MIKTIQAIAKLFKDIRYDSNDPIGILFYMDFPFTRNKYIRIIDGNNEDTR